MSEFVGRATWRFSLKGPSGPEAVSVNVESGGLIIIKVGMSSSEVTPRQLDTLRKFLEHLLEEELWLDDPEDG